MTDLYFYAASLLTYKTVSVLKFNRKEYICVDSLYKGHQPFPKEWGHLTQGKKVRSQNPIQERLTYKHGRRRVTPKQQMTGCVTS